MTEKRDNYKIQMAQAKKHFLTYDQQELIGRCGLHYDAEYFYVTYLSEQYRIYRKSGDMQRLHGGDWIDGNGFGEVMTLLDWLCDSKADRYITGRWVNIVTQGPCFHSDLQENEEDPYAMLFQEQPEAFAAACKSMGGVPGPGGDVSYAVELMDGLRVLVQLWFGDEEFAPRLRCLWDENTLRYIRYETTWFAVGLLLRRIRENMGKYKQ